MGADEEATLRSLQEYKKVMASSIQHHRGRIVGTAGDNVLAEFASVVDAVQCAVEIQQVLRAKNGLLPEDGKISVNDLVIKAVAIALRQFPNINASFAGHESRVHTAINVGIAVALDWGLIVPVLKNSEEKNFLGLARGINDLAERARAKKLKPEEVQEGTFSITNPGIYGGLMGLPVINQPNVGILRLGEIQKLGDHGRHLGIVRPHRLLAEEEEVEPGELFCGRGDRPGRAQTVVTLRRHILDEDRLVSPHGQALFQDDQGFFPAHREDPNRPAFGLAQAQGRAAAAGGEAAQ
jgi:hypothetical protein